MKNIFFAFAAFALLLSACKKDKDPLLTDQFEAGDTVTIAFKKTAKLIPDGLKITFTGITEDSRCPTDAMCIWEGRAVAGFQAEKKGTIRVFSLTNNEKPETEPKQTINVFGRTVKLLGVTPYPVLGSSIDSTEYKVIIVVE